MFSIGVSKAVAIVGNVGKVDVWLLCFVYEVSTPAGRCARTGAGRRAGE